MRSFNDIKHNKQQWYRHVLGLCAAFHVTPNVGKLFWHYNVGELDCVRPDFFALVLSMGGRFCWIFLFRDPETYLGFRRPSRMYKLAVACTVVATTLPNGFVHVWALRAAYTSMRLFNTGLIQAVLAMMGWFPLTGLVWWMAWRFLLRPHDEDPDFEPTVKHGVQASIGSYTDEPQQSSAVAASTTDYLTQAYEAQRRGTRPDLVSSQADQEELVDSSSGLGQSNIEQGGSSSNEGASEARPLRCQTSARYDYMPQNHSGGHSWFFQPFLPFILTIYATLTMIFQLLLIHADRSYRLRAPSP